MKNIQVKINFLCMLFLIQVSLVAQNTINVFPNPFQEKATVSFLVKNEGYTQINTFNIDGKTNLSVGKYMLEGENSFQIILPKGIYLIKINGNGFSYSSKVISQIEDQIKPEIEFIGITNSQINSSEKTSMVNSDSNLPTVTTNSVTQIFGNSAMCGGIVSGTNGSITMEGVCWSTSVNPTITSCLSKTNDGVGIGLFLSSITGLSSNYTYYVKAYATNSFGTAYGNQLSFTTTGISQIPSITTIPASAITNNTVLLSGVLTSNGLSPMSSMGFCWSTKENPTITSGSSVQVQPNNEAITYTLTGLQEGTKYYVTTYATNSYGTAYGYQTSFTTESRPTVVTNAVTSVLFSGAVCGGNVTSAGSQPVTAYGVCWSVNVNPTIALSTKTIDGSGLSGVYTSSLSGLNKSTTYYVRSYATNSWGTAYGNQISFITPNPGPNITDIDGNIYNTVIIGNQTWMMQDLKVTHYRNGDVIPSGISNNAWISLNTGAYQNALNYYAGGSKSYFINLYNWYAVVDTRNLCPSGWHIPSDTEWTTLANNLGGVAVAGKKLKESGSSHWDQTLGSVIATNESGFTALPGCIRDGANGTVSGANREVDYWASTQSINYTKSADTWSMKWSDDNLSNSIYFMTSGLSVRCLMDNIISTPLTAIVSTNSIYTHNGIGNATVKASGGSSSYTYSWYIKDIVRGRNPLLSTLLSTINTTSASYSFTISLTGTLIVDCVVKDNVTGLTAENCQYITSK